MKCNEVNIKTSKSISGNCKSIRIKKNENGKRKCKFCNELISGPLKHVLKHCNYFRCNRKSDKNEQDEMKIV